MSETQELETLQQKVGKRAWYERYRPTKLEELQLVDWQMEKFKYYIENPQDVPNLIFVGLSGSGKTTLAHILIRHWIKCDEDVMIVNGAGIGIDDIRKDRNDPSKGKIFNFAATPPLKSKYKVVYIEELQKASVQDFYKYFRNAIEVLSDNCIFMVSTNSISELDAPFVKRFNVYTFNAIPEERVNAYIKKVLNSENVQYTDQDIDNLVKFNYPSVRDMLQIAQQYTVNGVLNLNIEVMTFNSRLVDLILNVSKTRDINSKEFNELSSLLKYNPHLIDINYVVKNIIYKVSPLARLKISKYSNVALNKLQADIAVFSLLGEILLDDSIDLNQ